MIPSARTSSTPQLRLNHPHRLPSRHRLNRLPPFPTVRRAAWPWPCSPPGWSPAASATASTVGAGVAAPAPAPGSFAAIYQQTAPGVVMISTAIARGGARSFSQAEGSGIVVDKQGDILTNAHVVSAATQIQVTFHDGHTASGQVKEWTRAQTWPWSKF